MLCKQEGIWCTYVAGVTHLTEEELKKNVEGSTGRHAWNLIRIDHVYAYNIPPKKRLRYSLAWSIIKVHDIGIDPWISCLGEE